LWRAGGKTQTDKTKGEQRQFLAAHLYVDERADRGAGCDTGCDVVGHKGGGAVAFIWF
jgi:hypothetical protein